MTPTDEAKAALEEAHDTACDLVTLDRRTPQHDEHPGTHHCRLRHAAIDRAVRKTLEAAADEAHQEYLNAVTADSMSRYDEGHAHGTQRIKQRIRSLISALGLGEPEGRRGENSYGDTPDV